QGSFVLTLEQAPPGRYGGTVLLEEYVDLTRRVELEAGQVEQTEITLLAAGQVHGVVLADGVPMEDATVALVAVEDQDDPFGFSLDSFRSHGGIPDEVPEFQQTSTDAQGHFVLAKNAPGQYNLLVASERHLPEVFQLDKEVLARRDIDLGSFDLDLGFGLDLVVRDPSGEALPDVEVRWNRHASNSLISLARDGRIEDVEAAVTGSDGHAFLGGLPSERLQLTLQHEEFARLVEEYDFSGRTDPTTDLLEITMDPGASVSGQVVDGRTGTPIEGAELALQETETREEFLSMFGEDLWEAESAADGGFRFTRLPPGEYVLIAKHADFSETTHGPFQVDNVAVEDLMVMLHPGATLHVEVLDDEGFPIEDATVQVVNMADKINETATTDLNGMATLPPLAAGNYQVAHTNLGAFDTEENSGSVDVQVKFIKLEDYDEKTVTLGGLIQKADITGEVRRGSEIMPGATVAIITDSGVKAGVADKEGQYEILGVPLGTYTIIVQAGVALRGGSTTYDSIHIAQEGAMRHDVLLSEGGVEIHVTAAGTGKDLPNVPVAVRPLDGTNIQGGNFGLTDDKGLLQISSLAPGSYIISAGNLSAVFLSTGDAGLGSKQISPVEIRESSGMQRFEVALEEGATFRVRVRDSTGNLLKGVHLHYLDEQGQPMNILSMKGTNSKGVAQLEGLPSGPGIIKVRHTSLGVTEIPVNLRAGELQKKEVTLEAGTRVYVTPVDDNGTPLAGVLVTALDDRGAPASFLWSQEETQATNAAFFSGSAQKVGPLAPGDYQIQLYRPGKPPVRHPLTVDGGEEMHLQLPYSTDEG
ncbi:MAG: MSCRAMM family protein, partial [Planctomycetota bacterium]